MRHEKNRSCVQRELHVCVLRHFSHVQLFVTLWTVAHQASLSMEFSRQEYWSGLPFPSPGDLLDEEGNPAGLSSCSGGLRPLVELCVEPAAFTE